MNLARFGLFIDPKPAQDGAKATIAAAKSIKPALEDVAKTSKTAGAAQADLGTKGGKAGTQVSKGMKDAAKSTREAGKAAKEAGSGFEAMVSKIMNVVKALVAAYAAFKAIQGAATLAFSAIDKAAQMEGFRTRWAYLLGSFDAAKVKMAELQKFANVTPFDLPGVTQASLALATLKDTGFETMEGLKMVGDAAARAQQPIEDVASRIARLVNNLKRGGGSGDEARILGEWQVFSPEAVGQLSEAGNDASKFAENLKLVQTELLKSKNAMILMSTTWTGLVSTLGDAWGTALTRLGTPIIEGLKPALTEVTNFIDSMGAEIETWAPEIEAFGSRVSAILKVMGEDGGLRLTLEAAADSFGVYFKRAALAGTDIITGHLPEIGNKLWEIMTKVGQRLIEVIMDGLSSILPSIGKMIVGAAQKDLIGSQISIQNGLAKAGNFVGLIPDSDLPDVLEQNAKDGTALVKAAQAELDANYKDYINTPRGDLFPTAGSQSTIDQVLARAQKLAPATDKMNQWADAVANAQAVQEKDKEDQALTNDKLVGDALKEREAAAAAAKASGGGIIADKKKGGGGGGKSAMEKMQDEAARIIESTRTPDEVFKETLSRLDQLRDAGLLNEEQYQRAVQKSAEEYKSSVESAAAASEAAAQRMMTPLQKLAAQWGSLGKNVQQALADITSAISDNIAGGITAMIDGTKSAKEAFSDMAKGIVDSIVKIIVQLAVQYAISQALGIAMPVQPLNISSLTASVKHDGGSVSGGGGASRSVPAGVFAGAQRYHQGGTIGSNEVPIIAEQGESVLTKEQSADIKERLRGDRKKQSGSEVTILNVTDMRMVETHMMRHPEALLNVLSQNAPAAQRILNNGRS